MKSAGLINAIGGAILLFTSGVSISGDRVNTVLRWNKIGQQTVAAANPFIQSRAMAMTQLAVHDAMRRATVSSGSLEAAAMTAAHDVLLTLFPESAGLDAEWGADLAKVADGEAKARGIETGKMAAVNLLQARREDRWDAKVDYRPGNSPGTWVPTPPAFAPALYPHWGSVTPFVLTRGDQFRPDPPSSIESKTYISNLREVVEMGGEVSALRSAEQTNIARFWIGSALQGWNPIARQASIAAKHTPADAALTLAMLNAAIADALIVSFDAKYTYNTRRPVTAIRAGVGGVESVPEWLPLIATPPFPGYPSAHAIAAGAAQEVLERRFGPDGHAFVLTSATAPGVVFRYTSFAAIANQIDDARVFGGIHVREDQDVGHQVGRHVGGYVFETMMTKK